MKMLSHLVHEQYQKTMLVNIFIGVTKYKQRWKEVESDLLSASELFTGLGVEKPPNTHPYPLAPRSSLFLFFSFCFYTLVAQ